MSSPPPQPGKSILIIEDDPSSREVIGQILAAKGYATATAEDGNQALLYLRQQRPSLILLDLLMPVMDGYEFRRRQMQDPALASIPVVVLSARGDDAERADALGGVVGYLQKPLDPAEVVGAVERFTVSRRPEVLVVEDDADVRAMLDSALPHFGFGVRLAADGTEAVELFRRHRDTITLVLLDVQMPGLDGPQTLAAMQGIDPLVRCCFMSGNTGEYTLAELLGLGALHVFAKPFGRLRDFTEVLWGFAG